jgi:hypothetical protein
LSVYAINPQPGAGAAISRVVSGVNPYVTDDAGDLANNRTVLVLVVINPASEGDDAAFTLNVEKVPPPPPNFANLANLDFTLNESCAPADGSHTIDCSVITGGAVTWSGNNFTAAYSGGNRIFSVSGSLNADRSKILSLSFTLTDSYYTSGSQWVWNVKGSATNYSADAAWSSATTQIDFETGPGSTGVLNEALDITDPIVSEHYSATAIQDLKITFHP